MGYWSTHPMGGDSPLDVLSYLEDYLLKLEGKELDEEYEFFGDLPYEERKSMYEKHKYELLNGFTDYMNKNHKYYEGYEFVLIYRLIYHDIRFPNKYIDKLVEMLGDGGATERGYELNEKDSPYMYIKKIVDNKELIFSEEKSIKDVPQDIVESLYCPGLLQTIFEKIDKDGPGLVNTK